MEENGRYGSNGISTNICLQQFAVQADKKEIIDYYNKNSFTQNLGGNIKRIYCIYFTSLIHWFGSKSSFYVSIHAKNTCFLLIPVKSVAVLQNIKFLKNPRWRPKERTCCENGCCHGNSS